MITAFVTGSDKVTARFDSMGDRLRAEIVKATQTNAIRLAAYVQKNKLSGQSLKNQTGRLRRSITFKVDDSNADSVTGTVGTNVEYAAIHEYGFSGTVNVREHLRMQIVAWGKQMKNPHEVTVKGHSMKMNVPEKSFLRSSLAENSASIRAEYEAAVKRALK